MGLRKAMLQCPNCAASHHVTACPRTVGQRVVALVGCSKKKLDQVAPARELYRSPLFQKSLAYAEKIASPGLVWILSAKHGLVEPNQALEPYDLSLEQFEPWELDDWAHVVGIHLGDALDLPFVSDATRWPNVRIVLLASSRYAPQVPVETPIEQPLKGMEIGQRLSWLTKAVDQ